tara:strand:- start:693 stop:1718 length:1026 start_codon:yes stop_codon:yes gene_type:complete
MSKIKSNRLEPRATNGSLTIGNPESYTAFEGDVQIPGYATKEWVEGIITEDIAVELSAYQKRDEKDHSGGYAGLGSNGKVPAERLDTTAIEQGISQLESTKADITYVDAQDNSIKDDYLPLSAGSDHKMAGTLYMGGNRIKGLAGTRENSQDAVSYEGADREYLRNDGGTMSGEIDMGSNKIKGLATPTANNHAATKGYVDGIVPSSDSTPGCMSYLLTSGGKANGSYANGDLFFTTENNVAYTRNFDEVHFVCFAYRDRHGKFWHFAKQSGNITAPPCHIYVMYDDHTMGAFTYEGATLGAYVGNTTGNLLVPVTGWISCTDQTSVTAGSGYKLKCEWFI